MVRMTKPPMPGMEVIRKAFRESQENLKYFFVI